MRKEFLNKEQFDNLITICVLIVVTGFLAAAYFNSKTSNEVKSQIVTAFIFIISTLINFRYGSSRGQNRQAETIDNLLTPSPGTTEIRTTQTNKDEKINTGTSN